MKSKKILVIDDDLLVSKSLKKLLEIKGFVAATASSAEEGFKAASAENFDLVISDIRMPGQNGIIAIQRIKQLYEEQNVHCGYMFITGYAEEDTPEHAIRLGVNKFLFKPFDSEQFVKGIEEELGLLDAENKLREAISRPAPTHVAVARKEISKLNRVVITGIGAVAPNGIGKENYWNGLRDGKNCVDKISFFDVSAFSSKMAAEIRDFDAENYISEKSEIRRMGRSSHLAVAAAQLAIQDAGLKRNGTLRSEQAGVILGSAVSGLEYVEIDFRALERGGVRKVRPYLGIAGFGGAISSEISRALGLRGPSITISTGCTSSTDAMGYAFEMIRNGKNDVLITGGADACITSGILAAFCQMGAVSTWPEEFHRASRPFNKDRGGFVIGEGSWVYVFEALEHAINRKATIYGEVLGYGASCDAWHMAKPHPSGEYTAQAIQAALDDAGVSPEKVQLFEAYGNGTPVNDSYETGVVKKVFGKHAYEILMPSIKSMLGHPLGASGAQQVGAVLLAFQEGIVHPTINYEIPDPECDLDYVPNKARKKQISIAVCSSIAFGAKNSAIVIKAFKA